MATKTKGKWTSIYDPVIVGRRKYVYHSAYQTKDAAKRELKRLHQSAHWARMKAHKRPTGTIYGVYVHG